MDVQKSYLVDWVEFNGSLPGGPKPCPWYLNASTFDPYLYSHSASPVELPCSQVCNNTYALMDDTTPSNLITCGQWSMLVNAWALWNVSQILLAYDSPSLEFSDSRPIPTINADSWDSLLKPFESIGFEVLDQVNAKSSARLFKDLYPASLIGSSAVGAGFMYADLIASCLQTIYLRIVLGTEQFVAGTIPNACTADQIFSPTFTGHSNETLIIQALNPMTFSLRTCLDQICSPLSLNSDLAGIGVFLSFIMQSAIALLSAIALGLITYRPSSRSAAKFHIESFVAALVDFHKAQCYFSSMIQVTALLLYSQRLPKFQPWAHQLVAQNSDFLDIFELGMLATGALIPINLVLYLVAKHGRQSWCLVFLAAVTSILGTATLASFTRFSTIEYNDSVEIDPSTIPNSARCFGATTASIDTLVTTWCGQRESQLQHLDAFQFSALWLWVPWTVSILTLLLCTINKLVDDFPRMSPLKRMLSNVHRRMLVRFLINTAWLACFAAQFSLFSSFYRNGFISSTWSFGQIIAVTVWVPSLVEFAYMEYLGVEEASKYRYPSPLKVMKAVAYQAINLADFTPSAKPNAGDTNVPLTHRETV